MNDYYWACVTSPYWYALKDAVRVRSRGFCEYCEQRPMEQLHHRHYGTLGHEQLSDVMGVCRPCHRVIEGLRNEVVVRVGSLADRGDTGRGTSTLWSRYLARVQEAAGIGCAL